jgi:hypothetical protein
MSFDFGELFTQSVRRVVPLLFEKKLACSFDCAGRASSCTATPTPFDAACTG